MSTRGPAPILGNLLCGEDSKSPFPGFLLNTPNLYRFRFADWSATLGTSFRRKYSCGDK